MFTLENRGCIRHLFWLSDMFSQKNDVMGLKIHNKDFKFKIW